MSRKKLIPLHGGHRELKSFQLAELVYGVTVRFCERHNPSSHRKDAKRS